jgi:glycosyltransferase involved in cell wall biosynthesis
MPINVAYDISILAADFARSDAVTGIHRVVNELMDELSHRDDLDVTAVALCGDDPLDDCTRVSLFLDHRNPAASCEFEYTYYPGRYLADTYKAVFQSLYAEAPDSPPSQRPGTLTRRYLRSALHRLAHYRRLVRPEGLFDRRTFDVFHCPHTQIPPRSRTGNLPRVLTVYDLIPILKPEFVDQHSTWVFETLLKRIDVEQDWVLSISEFTKGEFCERTGMSPERVRVVPLAADRFLHPVNDREVIAATRARYRVPEGDYLLCLAAPQPRKNLTHLIHSFFRLLDEQRLPDTYLVLAGSKGRGWMYDEIFAAAESSSRHRSRLIFTGYVEEEDLAALYSGAAAFVFPSLYEGFGLPALEAMMCGTPVITSNTTSLPEVVGDAAVLVDPTDPDELGEAMSRLLADHSLREDLRLKGLTRASEFSWKRCADLTVEMYEIAAGERARVGVEA